MKLAICVIRTFLQSSQNSIFKFRKKRRHLLQVTDFSVRQRKNLEVVFFLEFNQSAHCVRCLIFISHIFIIFNFYLQFWNHFLFPKTTIDKFKWRDPNSHCLLIWNIRSFFLRGHIFFLFNFQLLQQKIFFYKFLKNEKCCQLVMKLSDEFYERASILYWVNLHIIENHIFLPHFEKYEYLLKYLTFSWYQQNFHTKMAPNVYSARCPGS